ncbi:MAG: PHP-associated domain-containing protein [Chloroflexota bacterium]
MGKADLHIHTICSWDGTMTPAAALKAASLSGLDVIAITDHDDMRATFEARSLAGRYGIEVIPGIEITTADGHLLALFVEKIVPAGLPLIETLLRIGEQGGIAVAAHPEAPLTGSLDRKTLRAALEHADARQVLAGVEVYNAGLPYRFSNASARTIVDELPLAQAGNSDAHVPWGVGMGYTEFPGRTAADLRHALLQRTTLAHGAPGFITVRPILHWLWNYALKRAGWVSSNLQPQLPLSLARQPVSRSSML